MTDKYSERKRNRNKTLFRIQLGVFQCIYKPYLLLVHLTIVVLAIGLVAGKDYVLGNVDFPEVLLPLVQMATTVLVWVFPILLMIYSLETIGELTARKDEMDISEAFSKEELRNGPPILISKRVIKRTGTTIREFYSSIPRRVWDDKAEEIADALNVYYKESFMYGGIGNANGRRIVMRTGKGRIIPDRGNLYDEE